MTKTVNRSFLAVILFALVLAMAIHVFVHFAPGALSPDSFTILTQARSGIFEDGHPPLMAALWRGLDHVSPGPIGMLLLNLFLFYGGIYLIFLWLLPKHHIGVFLAALIVGLFPAIISILGVIWIDITMAGFFLFAVGIYLGGYARPEKGIAITAFLFALFFTSLGIAIRHNGAAAAFPLIALLLLFFFPAQWRPMARFVLVLLIGFLITTVLFVGTKKISAHYVDKPRDLWRVAAMYDIAGVSYHEKKNLFYSNILTKASLNDIYKLYSPRSFTPLVIGEQIHARPNMPMEKGSPFEFNLANPILNQQLRENWINVIAAHPGSYLRHRWDFFKSMVTRSPWGLWAPIFDAIYPNTLGIEERPVSDSNYFSYTRALSQQSMIFEPFVYLIISILMLIPNLVLGLRLQNHALLVASALYGSGLAHMTGLFFFAVSPDFRYSHWLITTTVLATSLIMLEMVQTAKTRFGSAFKFSAIRR
jgi:hypothetical protein